MSSEPVIKLEGAGKAYALFSKPEDRLKQMIFGRRRTYYQEFWALQPTDLEIHRGETWGIIGRNGSGKSTMLQMICGNLAPTTGRITVRGKVAALLELGAGFNPEFTGRENVYVNGALAGYDRDEIDARMDAILAFADIGAFIEQPVKTYSSGMFARLAFAVAINVEPDILVVDEALSVGDEAFQRKCFARMEEIKDGGATILFVSHSVAMINQLCDKAVLLHRGTQLFTGLPKIAVFYYQKLGSASPQEEGQLIEEIRSSSAAELKSSRVSEYADELSSAAGDSDNRDQEEDGRSLTATPAISEFFDENFKSQPQCYPIRGAAIRQFTIKNSAGERINFLFAGRKYRFEVEVDFLEDCPDVRVYTLIRTTTGVDLAGCAYPCLDDVGIDYPKGSRVVFNVEFTCYLNPGAYFTNVAVSGPGDILHHRIVDAFAFRVHVGERRHSTGLVDIYSRATHNEIRAEA